MSDNIAPELVDKMMVKCARRIMVNQEGKQTAEDRNVSQSRRNQ